MCSQGTHQSGQVLNQGSLLLNYYACVMKTVMSTALNLISVCVCPQEWVALESLEVDGIPGMTSALVSVFNIPLFPRPLFLRMFNLGRLLIPSTSETLHKVSSHTLRFRTGREAGQAPLPAFP